MQHTPSCVQCYDTCDQAPFSECEDAFDKCLKNRCRALARGGDAQLAEGCRSTAALFTAATRMGGCQYYKESQRAACDCSAHGGDGEVGPKRRQRSKKKNKKAADAKAGKGSGSSKHSKPTPTNPKQEL